MMDTKTRIQRLISILAGLGGFFLIVRLSGPDVHLLETVGALLFGFGTSFVVFKLLSQRMG